MEVLYPKTPTIDPFAFYLSILHPPILPFHHIVFDHSKVTASLVPLSVHPALYHPCPVHVSSCLLIKEKSLGAEDFRVSLKTGRDIL